MKKLFVAMVSAALAVGCGDVPTATDAPNADFAIAGASGCVTPKFNVAVALVSSSTFEGSITGDLEGTVEWVFDNNGTTVAGVTASEGGTVFWDISDGVLGPLTFETAFHNKSLRVVRPGSPSTVWELIGQHRASAGVKKANLNYTGTFSLATLTSSLDHSGVICP